MPTLIHVGYHKTATTFLQRQVFCREELGFRSPLDRPTLRRSFLCVNPFDCDPQRIRKSLLPNLELGRPSGLVDVISHEQLSGQPSGGGFGLRRRQRLLSPRETADLLHECFPGARVLVVVREQGAMISSIYRYLVNGWRGRLSASIDQFLDQGPFDREQYAPLFDLAYLEYHWLVSYYQHRFGKENLLVLPYEWMLRDRLHFLNEIFRFAGAPLIQQAPKGEVNLSPSALSCEIVRPFKRIVSSPNAPGGFSTAEGWITRLGNRLATAAPAALRDKAEKRLKARIARTVNGHYTTSNSRLQEMTGLDLAALGYELASPETVA